MCGKGQQVVTNVYEDSILYIKNSSVSYARVSIWLDGKLKKIWSEKQSVLKDIADDLLSQIEPYAHRCK